MRFFRFKNNYQLVIINWFDPSGMENGYKDLIDWLGCIWLHKDNEKKLYGLRFLGFTIIFSNYYWEIAL
jgi:hypothetical protein